MADTSPIGKKIEPFVRHWLANEFGVSFERKKLPLIGCEGTHEFSAVSEDGKIVAVIRSASGKTSGDNNPSAKIIVIFKDLYFLSLIKADTKVLVITDAEFLQILRSKLHGKIPKNILLRHCELPNELANLARTIRQKATDEIDKGKTA